MRRAFPSMSRRTGLICARPLEEDLAMSDRVPAPGDADDQPGSEPDVADADEFAKMRAVMRAQEKHREGGVDPELEDLDPDPDT
jgi:hypothetical protein